MLDDTKIKNIALPVSAPFHCSLMKTASKDMEEKINRIKFLKPETAIVANVTAKEENNPDTIKSLLVN